MKIDRQEIYRLAGVIGVALTLAGYFRYVIMGVWVGEGVMGKLTPGMLAVGVALMLFSVVFNFRSIVGAFRGRQGKLGANTIIMSVAVLGIIGIGNFLGYRHHKRFDMTAEGLNSISPQTTQIVANLSKDVKVIYFNDKDDQRFVDLMKEYQYAGKRFTYERIDPQQRPEMARQYKVRQMGDIFVTAGSRNENVTDISEQAITNAILKATRESLKTICFAEGHGEKLLSDKGPSGYAFIDQRLKDENYQLQTVLLAGKQQVPAECAALVVGGPKQSVTAPEAALIGKYLDDGGKALLLLDPETDPQLGDVLKSWGIQSDDNIVLDESKQNQAVGTGSVNPLVLDYGNHAITKDFARTMTAFPEARAIKINEGAGANSVAILKTSDGSYSKDKITPGQEPKYEPGKDQKGPLTLGAAASKNVNGKEARLVVIGDSDFASNAAFRFQRNGDLFLNSVNWLAGEEDLISIRAKSSAHRSVDMSASQYRTFFLLSVALMPLAIIGSGIYIWWKRR